MHCTGDGHLPGSGPRGVLDVHLDSIDRIRPFGQSIRSVRRSPLAAWGRPRVVLGVLAALKSHAQQPRTFNTF
eukprot:4611357-Pyramimonas_sp.AAC.1